MNNQWDEELTELLDADYAEYEAMINQERISDR